MQRVDGAVASKVKSLEYDGRKIEFWCEHILPPEFGFKRMIVQRNWAPLPMNYEGLAANTVPSVRRMAKHVGVAGAVSWASVEGSHRKTADVSNQAWARKFREDHAVFVQYWDTHPGAVSRRAPENLKKKRAAGARGAP